jgi:transposase-like protein
MTTALDAAHVSPRLIADAPRVPKVGDDLGSLDATPGSRPWAIAVADVLRRELRATRESNRHLFVMLDGFMEHRAWEQLPDERGYAFATFDAFCATRSPFGLGIDPKVIDELRKQRTPAERQAAVRRLQADGLTLRQIAKKLGVDHKTVASDLRSGENSPTFKAPKATGAPRRQVNVSTRDPESAARTLRQHFQGAALARLIAALREPEEHMEAPR